MQSYVWIRLFHLSISLLVSCIPSSKFVVVGDFDRNRMEDSQATYDVVDVISYPGYDRRTVNNDIALLRLESAIR